ncbi:tyrosine-type recombinase/integrase [Novosphingobium sp.]|uniref:tyrosine-type recombinase/integrase n=1 Tax=Novosphingobium sp. TaxID=1874826 RepID=UPI0038B76463
MHDAMTDYYTEKGQHLPSADPIRARFKLFTRFLAVEKDAGRIVGPLLPEHIDDPMLERFRTWGTADPIVAKRKDANGNWVDGKSRARSASTVEESVIQLKAALNHALKQRRTKYVPPLQHKTRDQVTPQRTYRLSVATIGEMLDYSLRGAGNYAGHGDRLLPLRRYLIAAICTLARPDAIFDMSVDPSRGQWMRDDHLFNLNQLGRVQTKKVRPMLPVVPLLASWLEATDDWFVCRERTRFDPKQKIDVMEQLPVNGIRTAWDGVCARFKIPDGWGPKLIRHSMATILANRGVDLIQLEMALGHRVLGKTSSRYAIFGPEYLASVRQGIEDVVADLTKAAGPALHAKLTQNAENVIVLRA